MKWKKMAYDGKMNTKIHFRISHRQEEMQIVIYMNNINYINIPFTFFLEY